MNMEQIRMIAIVEAAARALKLEPLPNDAADQLWIFGLQGLIECTIARQNASVSAWQRAQLYHYSQLFDEELRLKVAA